MRIISNFKDYYDFSGYAVHESDYRETIYIRNATLKVNEAALEHPNISRYNYDRYGDKIMSKWWIKNKRQFSLPDMPETVRAACLFICGKAFPLLFLRDTAQIGSEGKSGQIKFSRCFNEVIKSSIAKKKCKYYWQLNKRNEDEFNFFKPYYTLNEFWGDITIEPRSAYFYRRQKPDGYS